MSTVDLSKLSSTKILNMKISELSRGRVSKFIKKYKPLLLEDLRKKEIFLNPTIWCSTDWFSPDGESGFAFPFYLLDDQLKNIYLKHFYDLDGNHDEEILKLFRHEMSHVIDNTFGLRRLKKRQALFGISSSSYPLFYVPDLERKGFVENLGEAYGQSHPEEDWAETFAAWLSGEKFKICSESRKKYEYLDSIFISMVSGINVKKKPVTFVDNALTESRTFKQFITDKKSYVRQINSSLADQNIKFKNKKDLFKSVYKLSYGSKYSEIIARNIYNSMNFLGQESAKPTRKLEGDDLQSLDGLDRIIL